MWWPIPHSAIYDVLLSLSDLRGHLRTVLRTFSIAIFITQYSCAASEKGLNRSSTGYVVCTRLRDNYEITCIKSCSHCERNVHDSA